MVAQDGSLGSGTLRDALDITRTKDDYEIYEALRRVHLLPENLDEAELKGNPFASLETFVAVGMSSRPAPPRGITLTCAVQREQTLVQARSSSCVWLEPS